MPPIQRPAERRKYPCPVSASATPTGYNERTAGQAVQKSSESRNRRRSAPRILISLRKGHTIRQAVGSLPARRLGNGFGGKAMANFNEGRQAIQAPGAGLAPVAGRSKIRSAPGLTRPGAAAEYNRRTPDAGRRTPDAGRRTPDALRASSWWRRPGQSASRPEPSRSPNGGSATPRFTLPQLRSRPRRGGFPCRRRNPRLPPNPPAAVPGLPGGAGHLSPPHLNARRQP